MLSRGVQGGLLTAIDNNDNRLVTEQGVILDTSFICWILASTDRGKLGAAYDSRFMKAVLKPYKLFEMAVIIKRNRPAVPLEACERIALYSGRYAREAIDFAGEVIAECRRSSCDWSEAVEIIRQEYGIDEFGMPEMHLEILVALASRGPISKHAMRDVANCEAEELDEYILPVLRRDGLIQTTNRGIGISTVGLDELERRGLGRGGWRALPGAWR